ncbi:Cytochrome P450 [Macleaya cordata]|uniref:Cytochrome P450 n=1 Tax=Macleaya cordata TaxID=56857 RepID=A0A200R4E4_MACCD|nr:Cytochrome P450 [Macleaya cordata]
MDAFTPSSLYLAVVLAVFLVFLLLRRRNKRSPVVRLPPSPPKIPIIGHLHLVTDMPHHSFSQLSKKLGPIIYLQLGRVPTLVVSSARLAREIMKTQDHVFASRPQIIAGEYLSFGCSDITFSPYGAYWRQARKICVTELLSPKRVSSFQLIRNEEVNRLIEYVSKLSGSEIDMSEKFFGLANDVLCRVAFGKRFIGESNRLPEILTETQALLAGFSIADFYPGLEWVNSVTGLKRRLLKNLSDLRSVCDEIIGEHLEKKEKAGGGDISDREDFVDVLLRVQKGGDLEVPITDDNLKALVLDMFVAGTDTTSATLEWTLTELSRHQTVMKKAQEEVREAVGIKGKVDFNHLPQLNYMRAVIKEALRLHPPVPLLVPRESMEKCKIDGYDIPAKTRVFINTYDIGRDPQSWVNPLEYNPERFMDGSNSSKEIDVKGHQDFDLLPFGGGRRGCPGYSFALATIEIALARLLYHFDWSLPLGVRADDVDLNEIFGLATRKKVPLVLVPTINEDYVFNGSS